MKLLEKLNNYFVLRRKAKCRVFAIMKIPKYTIDNCEYNVGLIPIYYILGSSINMLGYSNKLDTLYVLLRTSDLYAYKGVTLSEFETLINSPKPELYIKDIINRLQATFVTNIPIQTESSEI